MIEHSIAILGVLGGIVLAHQVADETSWYGNWFFRFALALEVVAVVPMFISSSWTMRFGTLILLGVLLHSTAQSRVWAVATTYTLLLIFGPLLTAQILLIAGIPIAGWLWTTSEKKQLWWFAATPILIIAASLLI